MRNFNILTITAVAVLALSACGSADSGYLGSRDDIIVNNKGAPAKAPVTDAEMVPSAPEAKMEAVKEDGAAPMKEAGKDDVTEVVVKTTKVIVETVSPEEEIIPIVGNTTPVPTAITPTPMSEPVTMSEPVVMSTPTPTPTMPAPMSRTTMSAPASAMSPKVEMASMVSAGNVPANAKPGECYAKVLTPAVTASKTEQVKISEEQNILARIIPAKYEVTKEQVLIKEARQYWKQGRGPVEKVNQGTGEIMCLIEEPAEYKTVEKRTLVEPEKPEYKLVPAQYEHVTKTTVIEPERMEWRRILCETNVTSGTITRIQQALHTKGYNVGKIDGKLGAKTLKAINGFQVKSGLASSGITYETLDRLGVSLVGA